MKIVIHDANILIDLFEGGLLDAFFSLGWDSHSTDLVLNEINQNIDRKRIKKHVLNASEVANAVSMSHRISRTLTVQDCSVLLLAQSLGPDAHLLTGDSCLRNAAAKSGIFVHGILWILDQLVKNLVVSPSEASDALMKILDSGSRLPRFECERRFNAWGKRNDTTT